MKHQIILLGKDITSVYHGIKEFGPDHIHLLYTDATDHIETPMYPLLPSSIRCNRYKAEPYNGNNVIDVCRRIHREHQGEFTYNLSEGTKVMAFAAFVVAKESGADAFYLTQHGEVVHLSRFENHPLQSSLNNDEILSLSGNTLSDYHDAKELSDEDVKASKRIKQFIEQYPQEHARIQKFFSIFCKRQLNRLPSSKIFANNLRFKHRNGSILVTLREYVLLRLPQSNATHLYFEGRWWETLVANQVRNWSLQRENSPEVWQSVIFQTNGQDAHPKNEIDVLLNNQQKLIFIECKSGNVTQNDIYKIDAVRETYGGDISQAVLASYYPIEESLQEKCKDLQIYLFAPTFLTERNTYLNKMPAWLDKLADELQL
ncbi:DUF1887 family CARF protein [Parabacteroides sp. AF17-28]|uniref:Card1-like endonuclease domain-containing protein n=1 Tax=Parabacteroides sp. AF17-28 TaxID=2292241 RepID=UPI000EFFF28D|nr:DUF1887 family CARF protein [Parabacteroides sp. AF17-28]RHR61090.1 DUF1887 family protein [Parabacteroides sp. AF17-28]